MSMNLHAESEKGEIKLWQTPTWVTDALLIDDKGGIRERSGKEARRALRGYMQWVISHSNNGTTEEDRAIIRMNVHDHLEYIRGHIKDKSLKVYMV